MILIIYILYKFYIVKIIFVIFHITPQRLYAIYKYKLILDKVHTIVNSNCIICERNSLTFNWRRRMNG